MQTIFFKKFTNHKQTRNFARKQQLNIFLKKNSQLKVNNQNQKKITNKWDESEIKTFCHKVKQYIFKVYITFVFNNKIMTNTVKSH